MNRIVRRSLVTIGVLLTSVSLVGCGSSHHMSRAKLNSMPKTSQTDYDLKTQAKKHNIKVAKNPSDFKKSSENKNTGVNGKSGKQFKGAKASTGLDGFVYKKSKNTLYVINSKKMANASYTDSRNAKSYMKRANNYTNSQIRSIMNKSHNKKMNIVSEFE